MKIKKLCESSGISPEILATAIGVKPNAMKNIVSGTRTPSPSTVSKIADFFHVNEQFLNMDAEKLSTPNHSTPKKNGGNSEHGD